MTLHSSLISPSLCSLKEDETGEAPMSRREERDSDSRRRRSRFDRESSPKRSRRDGKTTPERIPSKTKLDIKNQAGKDQKYHHRMQDGSPREPRVTSDSKIEIAPVSKEPDRKSNARCEEIKHSSNASEVPQSRSYFEHDERGNARQVGRSSAQGTTRERGWWNDSKDQQNRRTEDKTTTKDERKRVERTKGYEKDSWKHDGFNELEVDPRPARKRPAFREKKIQVDSDNADKVARDTVKSSNPERLTVGKRKEEDDRSRRHLDKSEKPFAGDRATNKRDAERYGFRPRERFGNRNDNVNYRGRDGFSGRPGYSAGSTRVEKWKHDLYQEANRSPTPKNEEDQIAKVEELLAS